MNLRVAIAPLARLPALGRRRVEPDRFTIEATRAEHARPVFGAVAPAFRRHSMGVVALAFALFVITGPRKRFVLLFAQHIVRRLCRVSAIMVVVALGLAGLLAGRFSPTDGVGGRLPRSR